MVKHVIHIFLLSCTKATFFIEKQKEGKLSLIEKGQLKMHLRICKYCSLYSRQSNLLDTLMRQRSLNQIKSSASLTLSEEVKAKMEEALKERLKKK